MQRLYDRLLEAALAEDQVDLDITTQATVPAEASGTGRIIARQPGVVAGLPVAAAVFARLSPDLSIETFVADGARLEPGMTLAELRGPLRPLLSGERVALNFLQHLSGIATATAALVELVRGTGARILDTRKTTPGWRALEKYAVRMGGGANHRYSLAEMVLIKDNHIAAAGSLTEAVRRVRENAPPYARVEVEAENEAQVREALAAGVDLILLDNMTPEELGRMVRLAAGHAKLEASGNISAATVAAVAAAGVDFISSGAITHSAPALDLSLEIVQA